MIDTNRYRVRYQTPTGPTYRIYSKHYVAVSAMARSIAKRNGWVVSLVEQVI